MMLIVPVLHKLHATRKLPYFALDLHSQVAHYQESTKRRGHP